MPRNDAVAPGHVCPGIPNPAIASIQPPGIGIPPIAAPGIDAHQTIVTTALAAKTSAETAQNRAPTTTMGSALVVFVMAAPPEARLVASLGCAVQPLVHAPEA